MDQPLWLETVFTILFVIFIEYDISKEILKIELYDKTAINVFDGFFHFFSIYILKVNILNQI